jgi:hypothetical protein
MHPFDANLERERRHDAEETHLHAFQKADRLADKAPASDVDPLDDPVLLGALDFLRKVKGSA